MRAITWPLCTWSLKSTSTSVTWPEIWLPTSTVEIAASVPVAEMATRISPRSTAAVRNPPSAAAALRADHHQPAAPRTTRARTIATVRGAMGRRDLRAVEAIRGEVRGNGDEDAANARIVASLTANDELRSAHELDRGQGPASGHALEHHRPAEALAQAAHHRQAQPHAADVLVRAIERIEGPLQGFARHADARVAHADAVLFDADLDVALVGVLAGIAEQVAHHHREHARRRMQFWLRALDHAQFHRLAFQQRLHLVDFLGHDVGDGEV